MPASTRHIQNWTNIVLWRKQLKNSVGVADNTRGYFWNRHNNTPAQPWLLWIPIFCQLPLWLHSIYMYIYLKSSTFKVSLTFNLWKGSADWANRSSTTAKWPKAHAKESGVWSLLVVCLLTSARFEMRNCTVHRWPARQAFINGVRPPSDSCSC